MIELWKKLVAAAIQKFRVLQRIHDTPHSIAGGVALGILISFTPLFFCRIILAVVIAWAFRCNKVAAALAVNLHEFIFFLWPFVLRQEYRVGFWLLSSPHVFPPHINGGNLEKLFHWAALREYIQNWQRIGFPWMVGSMVFGIPISIASFFITLRIVQHYQAAQKRL